ncbi:hypothetical protein RSOLAG22IIIB_10970 [Rhizoctonia solani]|uniref:VWFA domain-containing protein n=1 Tax=Rhizoctonia solani TaxID=456999 RepID=A0A0K6G6I5_9AGAM|nr:hypothetical protein RSOLAG22IIIB_10970 [Rhizoctonia solani]
MPGPELPPLMAIPNMFRLFELVDEYDSRGTVEKIVIDQHSLGQFLNTVQPGSYHSVSKIDLKELDKLSIRPVGVYGIRSEIIRFLQQVQYLNDNSATLLSRISSPDNSSPGLKSGLYLALDPNRQEQGASKDAYIIYWPEDTTWDDQAAPSVQRNRVIFMHYLNKLTDQIISLISSAQARTLIWDTNIYNEDLPEDQQDDDNARLVDFEVTESLKQEEDAIGSPGFRVIVGPGLLPQVDEQTGSRVRLVPGEQRTALRVVRGGNDQLEEEGFESDINSMSLRTMIGSIDCPLQLGNLTPADLDVLAAHGLRDQYGQIFAKYDEHLQGLDAERTRLEDADKGQIDDQINRDKLNIRAEIQHLIRVHYNKLYPSLRSGFNPPHGPEVAALLHQRYPHLGETVDEIDREQKLEVVRDSDFQSLKEKWPLIKGYLESNRMLSDDEHEESIDNMLRESNIDTRASANSNFTNGSTDISDLEFVSQLRAMGQTYFSLFGLIRRVHGALRRNLETLEQNVITDQLDKVISIESQRQKTAASAARGHEHCEGTRRAFNVVIQELREAMASDARQMRHVDWIESTHGSQDHRQHSSESVMFRWGGRITWLCPTPSHHSIYPLELTEQDSQLCRVDEAHVPQPKVDARHKFEFTLPKGRSAEFIQLVGNKCLVVVSEREQKRIFLEADDTIDHAINANLGKISFSHDSLGGPQCQFAFDETTRLLAIVHGHEHDLKLSVYIFGELFTNLRNRGSPISLRPWYENQPIIIKRVCFVSELEEVCFVEASGRTRIFSLITQQFRAEFLQIDRPVIDAFSAPDGSCLFVVVPGDQSNSQRLLAFHWASFGSNPNGIDSAALPSCDGYRIATRFLGRGPTHVVSFDAASKALGSVVLQIMQKETEFLFRSRTNEETHNSLIDCHLEVWTQFPLIPSITRDTPIALNRRPRQLIFASPITLKWIEAHFASIISTFARKTKKPMAQTLTSIRVKTTNEVGRCIVNATSEFKLGSFIVELLCLIPLRLAVAKDDCLIPLKDGVRDSEFEHSLLGASVPSIVDAMSLGWYESLFQSYMATKPVRVVSAMGEQGAGKSYYLNHFAGTSFLGSKMSTADGVWLSCTPTEDYLLVSLDFRAIPDTNSAAQNTQDNMVLVLLNTAISNLLLLRNGFETSRNVSGLFRAFQSAVGILDSDAYQELFNSSLAIIIKDIANTDSKDIVNEFALKFQRMVEHERGQNFITRLHNGCVQIIPWPVIDSPSFYTLFGRLRQRLEQQPFTYSDGGTFLYNLKTLIAKINTNDWGSMYSNIAACRAQRLMAGLPIALSFGRHEEGPLKNMDTDEDLETPDYMPSLFVPEFAVNNATQSHAQQLHETSHGSMTTTQWVLESDKNDAGLVYELQGRKFGSGDDGTPMFCHLVCAAMGRHAHIDYCRRDSEYCSNTDCEHITKRIRPNPDREKDWISHATFWARSGFKDPYSREQQKEFSLCDVLCAGPEHEATATSAASPSYCTLPMFHPPQHPGVTPTGYTSVDGHSFKCRHPSRLQQAYHIVFVIDGSGSMANTDRRPLPDMPISARLISSCNNRYGAVLSALYGFWLSRDAVALLGATQTRQDAYSIVTFNHRATTRVRNDFTSSADQLIAKLLSRPSGGVNAHAALTEAQSVIRTHWSNDRAPVVIFLSDGECKVEDGPIYDLCRMCVQLGKAPAFYSISIGEDKYSTSLRRMAKIAHEVFASAPQDLLTTGHGNPCEYVNAIDSIQLAGTFLGITNSLQKPRASLMNQYGPGGRRAAF